MFSEPSSLRVLPHRPNPELLQEVIGGICFAAAGVKCPHPSRDLKAPFFGVRDTKFPCGAVKVCSEGFVLHLHPHVRLELELVLSRTFWVWDMFIFMFYF